MKTISASVLSAVIAGLVLFFAQNWWSESQNASKQTLRFDQISSIELTKDQLQNLLKKSNGIQNTSIGIYKAKNIGKDDIADSSFSGSIPDAIDYGSIKYPNGNPKSADISFDGKAISIKYHLLPSNNEHTFWVASYAPSAEINFSNDTKGIHVMSLSDKIDAENPFPWGFLGALALLVILFLIGIGVGSAWITSELKKRGVDADAIMKQPIAPTTPGAP